jgi:uncharacterized protein YggT (Ycf19 family)
MVSASVFMPYTKSTTSASMRYVNHPQKQLTNHLSKADLQNLRLALRRRQQSSSSLDLATMAMAIPGYGVAEQVIVGGFGNFLSIYNLVITARILLSWFPQAASIGALQPVYAITDPYLNLFRNIIPPLFGLDFSPILAFLLLNVLTNATAAVGCEIPKGMTATGKSHHHCIGDNYFNVNQKSSEQQRQFVAWKAFRNI